MLLSGRYWQEESSVLQRCHSESPGGPSTSSRLTQNRNELLLQGIAGTLLGGESVRQERGNYGEEEIRSQKGQMIFQGPSEEFPVWTPW